MKKLIALLLCTVLLAGMTVCFADSDTWTCESCGRESSGKFCPYCGAAKPEEEIFPEAPAGTFSIRNGIRWGMSGYEVETREEHLKGVDDESRYYSYDPEYDRMTYLSYYSSEKKVSIFPASLNYRFCRDKLFLVGYTVEMYDIELDYTFLETAAYLRNAMAAKYGEGRDLSPEEREQLGYVMILGDYSYYEEDISKLTVWDLPEDTKAVLAESFYEGTCRLIFYHYDTMLNGLPEDGAYNTNGL